MKTKEWLLKAKMWVSALPVEMLRTWEEKNPGRGIASTLDLVEKTMKVGNCLMAGSCIFLLLGMLLASPGLEEYKRFLPWFLVTSMILLAVSGGLEIWMGIPEARIDHFMRSFSAMRECGLVPRSIDGSKKIDLKAVLEYARARLTQNAQYVRNAQTTLGNLEGSGLDAEIAIAAESSLEFNGQLSHALNVAVEVGLSTGDKTPYFREAMKRT